MGQVIVLPGAGPGVGPYLPENLHDAGHPGANHRYVADRVGGILGSAPAALQDQVGTLNLSGASNVALKLAEAGSPARRYLGRTAAAGAVGGQLTTAVAEAFVPSTVAAVVRADTLAVEFLRMAGAGIRRAGNGAWQAGGFLSGTVTRPGSANWALLLVHVNHGPNLVTLWVDGGAGSTPTAFTTNAGGAFGAVVGSNAAATVEVAEVITWPSLLDETARAAVRAALMARYSFLP